MHLLEFTLKQHTPIIHFQHDQDGATLRATEVKPKLDRYIIEKFGGKVEMEKSWFNNFEKGSLDYKMRIEGTRQDEYFIFSTYENPKIQNQIKADFREKKFILNSPYFADNSLLKKKDEKIENKEKPIKVYDSVNSNLKEAKIGLKFSALKVTLITKDKKLQTEIENVIEEFFIYNNFGTRQSKGFGCFSVDSINKVLVNNDFEKIVLKSKKTNEIFRTNINEKGAGLFENISNSYKVLKSGINIPFGNNPKYLKSLLFLYFCEKHTTRWEKRWIKQKAKENTKLDDFKNGNKSIGCDCSKTLEVPISPNYRYVRAVMGLAETNEYQTNSHNNKYIVEVDGGGIERYQSPLLVKVHNGKVYFICNNDFEVIKDKAIDFKLHSKRGDIKSHNADFGVLNTPEEFDLVDFLNWSNSHMKNVKSKDERDEKCKDDLKDYCFEIVQIKPPLEKPKS